MFLKLSLTSFIINALENLNGFKKNVKKNVEHREAQIIKY